MQLKLLRTSIVQCSRKNEQVDRVGAIDSGAGA
ncbi:hypothetical protein NIES2135_64790 (plasmid) [Leptolyngbya boryana NIES-2135]|jgi:hypothetical protein|uniref:Uncharacterized protein n=1 Tax=Leptolyngbya boryana NIES-2135 TaxID=1973484 RepID=A0A1Z4JSA2_LEPBY|nr:hypothetical protein NIES2135_64790 [Leptolyngbya boryana NIES-2135]